MSRTAKVPAESDVLAWFDSLSNWGRWGDDDELGTLNLISPEVRRRAAQQVREGRRVSCGRNVEPGLDGPVHRFMDGTGEGLADEHRVTSPHSLEYGTGRFAGASEYIGMMFHGRDVTHLDALSHIFWDRRMYNGRAAELVTSSLGATANDVTAAGEGVFTRGVLLDVAAALGIDWLESGEGVFPWDLEAAELQMDVRVEEGDAMLVRTGHGRRRREAGPARALSEGGQPGLHAASLPWLRERGVSLLGCDAATEVVPSGYTEMPLPVHVIGIAAMGLWLVDNLDLEELAATCARLGRWEFLFTLDPLRIVGCTGSPVNPVATF
jgi:kynurenine formamidase